MNENNTCEECGQLIDHIGLCDKHRAIWERNYPDYHQPDSANKPNRELAYNDFIPSRYW